MKRGVKVKGQLLKHMRDTVGLTQEGAAHKAGYSARLIRKLETGGPVSKRTLQDIVDCYHEHCESTCLPQAKQLIDESSPGKPTTEHKIETQLLKVLFSRVDPEQLPAILHADVRWSSPDGEFSGRDAVSDYVSQRQSHLTSGQLRIDHTIVREPSASIHWSVKPHPQNAEHKRTRPALLSGSTLIVFRNQLIEEVREHWNSVEPAASHNDSGDPRNDKEP